MARILIIDDEDSIQKLVSTVLEAEGHTPITRSDGQQGLEAVRAGLADLVISDIMMPGMTGFDLVVEMRKNPETATIPVIFITGVKEDHLMRQAMELGADDFLEKPFSTETLLSAIEARLRMREALRRQSDEQLAHLRQNITLSLPHELRTPLNAVLAFSQMMEQDPDSLESKDIRRFAKSINSAGKRLHRLIENYLLYAQIEIADFDPRIREELQDHVTAHVETVIRSYAREKAEEYQREEDLAFECADAHVRGSHDHVARMVIEVVDNALKFSQPGSPVRISFSVEGSTGGLTVSDSGSGMRAEDVDAIGAFMQFGRRVREQQGSGLGLAIARRLAQIYGGSLSIESALGEGTTVTVSLPVVSSE